MKAFKSWCALIVLEAVSGLGLLHAAELQPATTSAWETYVRAADLSMQARLNAAHPFLWIDEARGRKSRVQNGGILVEPVTGNGTQSVPNGLIHHWLGAAFIPDATLAGVLGVVHDYANFKQFYQPTIIDSKILHCSGEQQSFSVVYLNRVLFITAVFESQYATRDFPVDAKRWYTVAASTRVQEIENYGQPDEHLLPPGLGRGFVWRIHIITRYEERDGGVYIEMEVLGLSRDIPVSLRWLVNPVVTRLSENSLITSLRQTREAVKAAARKEQHLGFSDGSEPPAVTAKAEGH